MQTNSIDFSLFLCIIYIECFLSSTHNFTVMKKIFYLPKQNPFFVGENYKTFKGQHCVRAKWKISQGIGQFLEGDVAMEYVPELLLDLESEDLLRSFIKNSIDEFGVSSHSKALIIVVPNGEYMDSTYEFMADYLEYGWNQSMSLHFLSEPPPRTMYTTNLSLPFPLDEIVSCPIRI